MTQSGEETGQLLFVDLANEQYRLPIETTIRPDLAIYCSERKVIKCFQMTVCWETGVEAARLLKGERYAPLLESCREQGWTATCLPFEVGVRWFVGKEH